MSIVTTLLHNTMNMFKQPHLSLASPFKIHLCFGYKYLIVYAWSAVHFHLNCIFLMYMFGFASFSIKQRVLIVAIFISGRLASNEYFGM